MNFDSRGLTARYAIAFIAVSCGTFFHYFLSAQALSESLVPFILSIAIAALFGGFGPGLFATLLSIGAIYFLTVRETRVFLPSIADGARLGLLAASGLLISYIGYQRGRAVRSADDSRSALRESATAVVELEERRLETERVTNEKTERRWRESEILQTISRQLVGTLEFDKITAIVCRAVRDLTGADGATFVLHEGEQVFYADENAIMPLWKGQRFPIRACISGLSMIERKAIAIEDIYTDERVPIEAYRPTFVKSMAMMPIGPGDPVGAIGAYWADRRRVSRDELQLLQSLAGLADLALANARSYEEALEARAQAELASRLKDEFLTTVSHELRSPLNAVLGWASMLRRSKLLPDEQRELALVTIERNAKALASLVEDLLDVSRIISGKMRLEIGPLDLAELVHQTVENIRPAAEAKNITVRLTNDLRTATVGADAERLQQIIFNLLSNAVKFTQEDGLVEVDLRRANSHYEIRVRDNGRGISPEFMPFVFERFRQAERLTVGARAGLGLGLAIVKSLTEAHGGEIRAESEGEGKGATFTVTIPIAVQQTSAVPAAAPLARPLENLRLDGLRVLMVDDDPDVCEIVKAILEEHGALVVTAGSAAVGIDLFKTNKPDVVISDILMPEENGYQFIRQIRALERNEGGKSTPAVALTAKARVEDRLEALTAGFQMHVPKPIEPAELEIIVATLVERNRVH